VGVERGISVNGGKGQLEERVKGRGELGGRSCGKEYVNQKKKSGGGARKGRASNIRKKGKPVGNRCE